ncbi:RNA-directed DNA polymerase, eukaryota [Tanacetum coccineum]
MESIRSNFFKGASLSEKKISWIAWDKVLASKKKGGLGVSCYFALNRALLLKWAWCFVSQDGSLWFRVIQAVHGNKIVTHTVHKSSIWSVILKEVHVLKSTGFDFMSYCSKHSAKHICVADKMSGPLNMSFRRPASDRWYCSLSSSGDFCVKEVRTTIDDMALPSYPEPTRWVKFIPIKINIFVWPARRDCLPTRHNLVHKGVVLESTSCLVCLSGVEDVHHILFRCSLAQEVLHRVCRWWEMDFQHWNSFSEWEVWFSAIRLPVIVKSLMEGVFYVAWWFIWGF